MNCKSSENMTYVRRLLKRKQPGFCAALEQAVAEVDRACSAMVNSDRIIGGPDDDEEIRAHNCRFEYCTWPQGRCPHPE